MPSPHAAARHTPPRLGHHTGDDPTYITHRFNNIAAAATQARYHNGGIIIW